MASAEFQGKSTHRSCCAGSFGASRERGSPHTQALGRLRCVVMTRALKPPPSQDRPVGGDPRQDGIGVGHSCAACSDTFATSNAVSPRSFSYMRSRSARMTPHLSISSSIASISKPVRGGLGMPVDAIKLATTKPSHSNCRCASASSQRMIQLVRPCARLAVARDGPR